MEFRVSPSRYRSSSGFAPGVQVIRVGEVPPRLESLAMKQVQMLAVRESQRRIISTYGFKDKNKRRARGIRFIDKLESSSQGSTVEKPMFPGSKCRPEERIYSAAVLLAFGMG